MFQHVISNPKGDPLFIFGMVWIVCVMVTIAMLFPFHITSLIRTPFCMRSRCIHYDCTASVCRGGKYFMTRF